MSAEQLNNYLQFEANTIKTPYIVIASLVLIVAVLFFFTHLPEIKESDAADEKKSFSLNIFRHRHVTWAVIAQFFYVGAQVGVGSFFIRFSRFVMDMPEKNAAYLWGYIAMAGFMLGRFAGTFLMRYVAAVKIVGIVCHHKYYFTHDWNFNTRFCCSVCSDGRTFFYVHHVSYHFCTWHKRFG